MVCHKCEDREIGCHSKCEKYLREKEAHDKKNAAIRAQKKEQLLPIPKMLKSHHEKLKNQWSRNYGV